MSAPDDVDMDTASGSSLAPLGGEGRGQQKKCRVERLSGFLQWHRSRAVCSLSHDTLTGYFPDEEMAKVAGQCWKQVQPQIKEAISDKHGKIFSELQVLEKLNSLDQQQEKHKHSHPAWRPSGIPSEDYAVMEEAEAVAVIPELKKKMEEASAQSAELVKLLSEREKSCKPWVIRSRLNY